MKSRHGRGERVSFDEVQARERQLNGALNLLALGIVIVDAELRPVFANRFAERIFGERDGLLVHRRTLQAAKADATRALHKAIKSAIALASARSLDDARPIDISEAAAIIALPRPTRRRALIARVLPLPTEPVHGAMAPPAARAVVLIMRPRESSRIDVDVVASSLRLTPRQAALAALLAGGTSLRHAAASLGVTIETARWHLKEIFERTDTHRQADLIRLVMQIAATAIHDAIG